MHNARDVEAAQAALQYLLTAEIPGEHKRVLMEALTGRLRMLDAEERRRDAAESSADTWAAHENALIADFLKGKVASSWQHGDELLMSLAAQLHRNPREICAHATDLGFGAAVDFALARRLQRNGGEE